MSKAATNTLQSAGFINVKFSCGTHIARYKGRMASAASDPKSAAERVAEKVLQGRRFELRALYNNQYAWEVFAEVEAVKG